MADQEQLASTYLGGRRLPILAVLQRDSLRPELKEVIEYRKSGLSVNHVVGCPLDCGYCVRHLFDNFEMKVPRALMTDAEAAAMLFEHRYFQPHVTPIQLFNRATDPMLPPVKPHTFEMLRLLDDHCAGGAGIGRRACRGACGASGPQGARAGVARGVGSFRRPGRGVHGR
jgi:hypothetical protein